MVELFGESTRTINATSFFATLSRFVRAYQVTGSRLAGEGGGN